MSITFNSERNLFAIQTNNTEYAFQIVHGKFPVHLYYGAKEGAEYADYKEWVVSYAPYYKEHHLSYVPDTAMLEYSGYDSGDYRASSLKIRNKNGDCSTFLHYKGYNIFGGRLELPGLPFADADENTETLEITLADDLTGAQVKIYYTVFPEEDIISRYVAITNNSEDNMVIEKCMSLTLDLPHHEYDMISLHGKHYMERMYQRVPLHHGLQSIFSRRGYSSHHYNPFFALCSHDANEENGDVFGFNFVFSGSFADEVEVCQIGQTRIQVGLGEENFTWHLPAGETFVSPEAVMTFSDCGIGQMSRNFHNFIRRRILPPEPFEKRPVVLNTWEACYFKIDQEEMLRFADSAAQCGMDMLVMDDGWFGQRHSDWRALGDWYPNNEKFPDGLKTFIDKVKERGIKFGIWIEPEMVNDDSDLYRAHPDWCIHCKDRVRMPSRQQLVLDMGNPEVVQYLKDIFTKTFDGCAIDYFKWDMNRNISQAGSAILPPERQGEVYYRYMLGVYELFKWFREKYPNAMIENCAGGGGRYDLGMMKYSTMIWTSDNTVPSHRIKIQYSSLLAYPAATMSCHVANHQNSCEDPRQLKYGWEVAMGGALGYELHIPNASDTVKKTVKHQIEDYRKYEHLILRGDYYSLLNPYETNYSAYYYTDGKDFLLSFLQVAADTENEIVLPIAKADPSAQYLETTTGKTYSGAELIAGISAFSDSSDCNSQIWHFVLLN